MTVQEFWDNGIQFLNFCAVYYAIQLVRCVLFSFPVVAFVFVIRKTALQNRVFLKGALWSLLIPVLFVGKMKFFYENRIGVTLFFRLTGICMNHIWVSWLYLCGVFIYAVLLFSKRKKLKKIVSCMAKRNIEGTTVYATDIPVTPFTIGVFRPKIVMPEVILKEYSKKEFEMILLHEKTHIQLGHLLLYFLWDILRVLLWLNPFLAIGTKYFREDMEEICDWVTIKRSEGRAYAYGQLLLKSMRILQAKSENFNMFATFAGDKEYHNIRQRVTGIVRYRPYKRIAAVGTFVAAVVYVIASVVWVQNISYGRYNENDSIFAYGYDGEKVTFFDDSDIMCEMISYDDRYLYVDREAFESFLDKSNAAGQIYIVFGGFYKLPGISGIGYSCCYETDSMDKVVKIPYENPMDNWIVNLLFKVL